MVEARNRAHAFAMGSLLALLLLVPQRSDAVPPGPNNGTAPCSTCSNSCICIPNTASYGFFRTSWREWPGEARPDKNFPRSINKEVLPTPAGQEQLPVPPPIEAPGGRKGAGGLGPMQIQIPKGLLTPGGTFKLEGKPLGQPGAAEQPAEPGPSPFLPAPGGGLPGLPAPGGGLPGLPAPGGGLPGLPTEPEAAPPPESTAPSKQATPTETPPSSEAPSPPGGTTAPGEAKPAENSPPSAAAAAPKSRLRSTLLALPTDAVGAELLPRRGQAGTVAAAVPPGPTSPSRASLPAGAGRPPAESLLADSVLLAAHQAPLDLPLGSQVEKQVLPQPQAEPTHVAQGPWRQSDPPLALGGYCPVMLGKNEQWVKGDARCSVVHQGQTYRFAGQVQRECFLVDPDRYVPACAGDDPVLLKDENRRVPGQLEYCMTYDGRLYLFSAATTLARFQDEPKRYAAAPQH